MSNSLRSTTPFTRRTFLQGAGGLGLGAVMLPLISACGHSTGSTGVSGKLVTSWVSNGPEDKKTQSAVNAFASVHKRADVSAQFIQWDSYLPKMETLAAAGSLPDVFQNSVAWIKSFGTNHEVMDLTKHKLSTLNMGDYDPGLSAQGTVGGRYLGVACGGSFVANMYNASAIQAAGMQPPADNLTWTQYKSYLTDLAGKLPSGMYALDDNSAFDGAFNAWMRQHVKEVWTPAGQLAITKNDVQAWFQYWDDLRKAKLIPPGPVVYEADPNANPSITTGKVAQTFLWTNGLGSLQPLTKDTLNFARYPLGGKFVGEYVQANLMWTVSAKSRNPDGAMAFLNYFLHNPTALKIMGLDYGVPGSAAARKAVAPSLDSADRRQLGFFDKVAHLTRPTTALAPAGGADVYSALSRAAQAIGLGQSSVAAATDAFWQQSQQALNA